MRYLRLFLYAFLILAGAFLLFLLFATVDDYQPEDQVVIHAGNRAVALPDSAQLSFLIWNIGYAGLDASMDFFYDGGERVRPTKEETLRNLKGILNTLTQFTEQDFILLQEVDRSSKRSHHYDQVHIIQNHFNAYSAFFAQNYRVSFVPIPLRDPLGKVESGLLTLSRPEPLSVTRMAFPGNYSWPVKLFMLDRCFMVNRYPMAGGSQLVVINTHNSAYDDGSLRAMQMDYLRDFLLDEYQKGNCLIVGGDWNQTPGGFEPALPNHRFDTVNLTFIEKEYPAPGWRWVYDPRLPTNRRVTTPYDRDSSLTTVIDYYLLSPNVIPEYVRTLDTEFIYSDHQPVLLRVRLNGSINPDTPRP